MWAALPERMLQTRDWAICNGKFPPARVQTVRSVTRFFSSVRYNHNNFTGRGSDAPLWPPKPRPADWLGT